MTDDEAAVPARTGPAAPGVAAGPAGDPTPAGAERRADGAAGAR